LNCSGVRGEDGNFTLDATSYSAVGSQGEGLSLETAGLALMAYLKAEQKDENAIYHLVENIRKHRNSYGYFGNTHSTILCLKALSMYAEYTRKQESGGAFSLIANDKSTLHKSYPKGMDTPIVIDSLERFFGGRKGEITTQL